MTVLEEEYDFKVILLYHSLYKSILPFGACSNIGNDPVLLVLDHSNAIPLIVFQERGK